MGDTARNLFGIQSSFSEVEIFLERVAYLAEYLTENWLTMQIVSAKQFSLTKNFVSLN